MPQDAFLSHRPARAKPAGVRQDVPDAAPIVDPAALVAQVYAESDLPARARIIETLMRPLGALALVAVAGGAFAALRQRNGWATLQVTLDDALRVSASQVQDLSAYLLQSTPDALQRVAEAVADNPVALPSLTVLLLLQTLGRVRRGRGSPRRQQRREA